MVGYIYPELYISEEPIEKLISHCNEKFTLFLCDSHNYKLLYHYKNVELVTSCDILQLEKLHCYNICTMVVAVGGCTVCDVARMYAKKQGITLVCIPTILSTVCMSNNLSKLTVNGKSKLFTTVAPDRVIVHMPSLLGMQIDEKIKRTQSGFGDLLSNISASIDYQHKKGDLSLSKVKKNIPNVLEIVDRINNDFVEYNRVCMEKLAISIHQACLEVLKTNSNKFSSGGEHLFYYQLFDTMPRKQQIATHGQIVGIATLIMTKIYEKVTGTDSLYKDVREALSILSFPLDYPALEKINLGKNIIVAHMRKILREQSLLGLYFAHNGYGILDEIFS